METDELGDHNLSDMSDDEPWREDLDYDDKEMYINKWPAIGT